MAEPLTTYLSTDHSICLPRTSLKETNSATKISPKILSRRFNFTLFQKYLSPDIEDKASCTPLENGEVLVRVAADALSGPGV